MIGNMLIAHGGGPTPVINSSLLGAVIEAKKYTSIKNIYGARFGVEGILKDKLIDFGSISNTTLAKLSVTPASALGSCRRKLEPDDYPYVLDYFKKHNIRYFFYNGGNDSMDTCSKIHTLASESNYELFCIGIPKTIDNDLAETDHSPGFGSAARYAALSALELAMDAAALPIHVVVLEIMGRNAGWLTAASALFARSMPCETLVYLPEQALKRQSFLSHVESAWRKNRGLLVLISEGVKDENAVLYGNTGLKDGFGHVIAGGAAQSVADLIIKELKIKSRAEKPGLLGRVNMACVSPIDREEAFQAGVFAVKGAAEGKSGFMVAIEAERKPCYKSRMIFSPLEKVANVEKKFPDAWLPGEGQAPAREFSDYCLPIMDMSAPEYAYLGGIFD